MKQTLTHLFSLFLIPLVALHAADAPAENTALGLKFRVQQLHLDNNEGCAIADINKDGKLDISAGEFWYPGPDFKTQKPLRKLSPQPPDYLTNNGEHAWDVNGDGLPDIVSGSFMDTAICWYENPKAGGLAKGELWKKHVLVDTKLKENEATEFRDLDGDAVPELIVNSWNVSHPAMAYKLAKNDQGEPILNPWVIHESGGRVNGHGMGFGDINGDDLEDIIFGNGWYERPKQDAATKPWILHNDWNFPGASCPMLVVDLNGDGRNDIIWGNGHNFGLYWEEHREDKKDGKTNWQRHLIDDRFSQPHALAWEDIDNDGQPELITGRRFKAHSGNDPGDADPGVIYYFKWDKGQKKFQRFTVAENGPGIGLQIRVVDLNGNGWKDIVCAGKSGTHIFWNEGMQPSQVTAQAPPPIKDGKAVKLACVGDSITGGFGVTKGMSWPDQIAKMLGGTYEVGNFGLGGTYLFVYQRTDYYQNAIRFNPDVVVIMLGTNDVRPLAWKNSKPNFVTNYLAMIKQLSELPSKPRVFICYPPTITEPDGSEDNILELIPLMDEVAKRTKVSIIDIHGAFKGKGELIPDKIHPNDAGQTLIATTVYKALTGNAPPAP